MPRCFLNLTDPILILSISNLIQVSEASVTRSRSTIIVPAGNASDEGWAAFRNILVEIHEASQLLMPSPAGSVPPQVFYVD